MSIAVRSRSSQDDGGDGASSPAGWYPVEAHERYWTGEAWSDHIRPLRSPGPGPAALDATLGPNVIEEHKSFRWLRQKVSRTRLRGAGAALLALILSGGTQLFFWAADRPPEAPTVLVVQTPNGPVDKPARRHIRESCPASVAKVLAAPEDPWRWYGGVEYLLWEVKPRPGHSAMVMVNQKTGEVVCP